MKRVLVATAAVGAFVFSVFAITGGTVSEQMTWLTDAGITTVTHAATCPVRISPECVDAGRKAGLNVHLNERLRFPVSIRVMADGGRDVQLPPMNSNLARSCIEVVNWSDCTLDASGTARASAGANLGQALPFDLVGVVRKCVRAKFDAGLMCPLADGGSFGNRNVYRRTDTQNPAQCESVECAIYAGEDPEEAL